MRLHQKKVKIDIIGPYPPPLGGVSTHIQRIAKHLTHNNIDFQIVNQYKTDSNKSIYNIAWITGLLFKRKIVHVHIFSDILYPTLWLLKKINPRSTILITIHNERLLTKKTYPLIVKIIRATNYHKVISASEKLTNSLKSKNIKATYLPAYVPPEFDRTTNSPIIKSGYDLNICSNISRFYDNCISDYGLDFICELAGRFPRHAFTIFLGDRNSEAQLKDWLRNKPENLYVVSELNLVDHLPSFDIFLRLNRLDAYGVSIQEALDCGVVALATSVCTRPKGAVLVEAEITKIHNIYERVSSASAEERRMLIESHTPPIHHQTLIEIYKELVNLTRT